MIIIVSLQSCSTGDDAHLDNKDWKPSEEGYVITQGLYTATYNLIRDDCTTSLKDIKESLPDWPPDTLIVRREVLESPVVDFQTFHVRGDSTGYSMQLNDKEVAQFATLGESSSSGANGVQCDQDYSKAAYEVGWSYDYVVKSVADNVLELRVNSSWTVPERCGNGTDEWAGPASNMWIPESTCAESYTITYTLEEACPKSCEVEAQFVEGAQSTEDNPYLTPDTSGEWCVCDR